MQDAIAVVIPLLAVLFGLAALPSPGQLASTRRGDSIAAGLLVAYGALALLNLANRGVEFMGRRVIGLAPRYWLVDALASACLFGAAFLFAYGRAAGTRGTEASGSRWKTLGVRLLVTTGVVVVAGIALEMLRSARMIPISG